MVECIFIQQLHPVQRSCISYLFMDHPRSLGCPGISLSMARFVIIEKWTLIRIPSLFPFAHWPSKEDLNRTTTEWRRWVGGWMDDKTHDQWYRPAWAGQIFTWNKAGEATQQGQVRALTRKFKQKLRKRVLVLDGFLSLCVYSVVRLLSGCIARRGHGITEWQTR